MTKADWTCQCRAVNSPAAVYCEACGTERPNRPRVVVPMPGARAAPPAIPETHQPAKLAAYPELTPEDHVAAKAALAEIRAMLGAKGPPGERPSSPRGLPAVDPRIRADVERRGNQPERISVLLKLP